MNELEAIIAEEIARDGPITFARFMALALYHPTLGYYAGGGVGREPLGWEGDYFTSGDVHTLFGWCVGKQLAQMWELLGRPPRFDVIELGAGRGLLARDVWRYALERAPEWAAALRYTLADRAPSGSPLRMARERRLTAEIIALGVPASALAWADEVEAHADPAVTGCLLSNELVDALPVHILTIADGALAEVYVTVDAATGRLAETHGPLSTPELASYLDEYRIRWSAYPDGWRCEVCLEVGPWLRSAARLARGFMLTLDYGDTARALYTRDRRRGTLAVYTRHQLGERPLAHPGRQDLTAHVNFSALVRAGRAVGLRLAGLTTQERFLRGLGLMEEAEALGARLYPAAAFAERHTDRGQADYLRYKALLGAVATLVNPHGLGGFRVLVQHRGVPGAGRTLLGLRG